MKKSLILKTLFALLLVFCAAGYAPAKEHSPPKWHASITTTVLTADVAGEVVYNYAVQSETVCAFTESANTAVAETFKGVPSIYATELYLRRWPNSKAYCSTSLIKSYSEPFLPYNFVHGLTSDLGSKC